MYDLVGRRVVFRRPMQGRSVHGVIVQHLDLPRGHFYIADFGMEESPELLEFDGTRLRISTVGSTVDLLPDSIVLCTYKPGGPEHSTHCRYHVFLHEPKADDLDEAWLGLSSWERASVADIVRSGW